MRSTLPLRGVPVAASHGFTLIELMVVVTIIGMLMTMLFPAVQTAREGGRTAVCEGNLKNISQAIFAFISRDGERQMLPSGGWGSRWTGNPNLSGENQPGGWVYQILPYIEQDAVYNMGLGESDMTASATRRLSVVMPLFICPSRRIPALFPFVSTGRGAPSTPTMMFADTTQDVTLVPRGDYAMNAGDQPMCWFPSSNSAIEDIGPPTLADGIDPNWWSNPSNSVFYMQRQRTVPPYNPSMSNNWEPSGVSFRRGNIVRNGQNLFNFDQLLGCTISMIDGPRGDGRAYVYLLGEKCLDVARYNTGFDEGDDDSLFSGFGNDNYRTAYAPPARDTAEAFGGGGDPEGALLQAARRCRFGSAHTFGTHFVFCDGRIKTISYFIHPIVHAKLANRADNMLSTLMPQQAPNPSGVYRGVFWALRAPEPTTQIPNPNDNEF